MWGELEALAIQLLAQIPGERGCLIVGQIEGHPGDVGRLTVSGKAPNRASAGLLLPEPATEKIPEFQPVLPICCQVDLWASS